MTQQEGQQGDAERRFRRRERIRGRRGFARVFAARCSAGSPILVVYACANDVGHARLGLSVGRRVGNAVVRARVRRRMREAFRLHKQEITHGVDYICVAKPGAEVDEELAGQFVRLARRAVSKLDR